MSRNTKIKEFATIYKILEPSGHAFAESHDSGANIFINSRFLPPGTQPGTVIEVTAAEKYDAVSLRIVDSDGRSVTNSAHERR